MDEKLQVPIGGLETSQAEAVSELIANTVRPLEYYNARAKAEEIAKYTAAKLVEMSQEDPDSVLVACAGPRPVGFCLSKYDDGLIWLAWFGVDAGFRGVGLGSELLHALAKTLEARRAHKIWCDTRTENYRSQHVLEKFGFKKVAHLRNHWYGHDFFIWEWLA